MRNIKKIGILLIIFGAFIPSVSYPLATLTRSAELMKVAFAMQGTQYESSLNDLEVVFKEGKWIQGKGYEGYYEGRISVPHSYLIAFGITIAFIGISLIALTRKQP